MKLSKLLAVTLLCMGNIYAQHVKLVDKHLKDPIGDTVAGVTMSIWMDEKEFSEKQHEHIDGINGLFESIKDTYFDTVLRFNLYFDGIFSMLRAIGIQKPVKFRIDFKNGDTVDIWRLNGYNAEKFFNHISEKHR